MGGAIVGGRRARGYGSAPMSTPPPVIGTSIAGIRPGLLGRRFVEAGDGRAATPCERPVAGFTALD